GDRNVTGVQTCALPISRGGGGGAERRCGAKAVVEERERAVRVLDRAMLPGEGGVLRHREVGALAAQPPQHRRAVPGDLVDGAGVDRKSVVEGKSGGWGR